MNLWSTILTFAPCSFHTRPPSKFHHFVSHFNIMENSQGTQISLDANFLPWESGVNYDVTEVVVLPPSLLGPAKPPPPTQIRSVYQACWEVAEKHFPALCWEANMSPPHGRVIPRVNVWLLQLRVDVQNHRCQFLVAVHRVVSKSLKVQFFHLPREQISISNPVLFWIKLQGDRYKVKELLNIIFTLFFSNDQMVQFYPIKTQFEKIPLSVFTTSMRS